MSTVLVVTPIIITSWPAISAAVTGAVGALGFAAAQQLDQDLKALHATDTQLTRERIDVQDSEILGAAAGTSDEIVVQKDGMRARFSRDARGGLAVCMEGTGVSKRELRRVGEQLLGRVTQQYAYHRIVTQLKARNMTIVDEHITEDQSVKIRVRNW